MQSGGVGAAATDGGVGGVPAATFEVCEVQEDRLQLQPFLPYAQRCYASQTDRLLRKQASVWTKAGIINGAQHTPPHETHTAFALQHSEGIAVNHDTSTQG